MKLRDWRIRERLSLRAAARVCGIKNATMMRRYERGRVPAPEQMQAIITGTKGAVTADDWFETAVPA